MLLDGNGLVYRGYFALPPLTTSRGDLVNAVFGFASIVLRGFQDLKPDYLAVSFDLPGPTFRHDQYAEYKATRTRMPDDLRDQFPKVREIVKALRIPVYEMAGLRGRRRHRDDHQALDTRDGLETTIVTGDLDMLQLVTPRVRLMTTRSGVQNTVIYDVARIDERYGLRPDQMIDYKALKGDPTDNIPGVPGVGEKTAAKLIREFGDLETLFARLDEVKPGETPRQARGAPRADPHGQEPLDDRPRPADRARPRGGAPRRLRPRHRRPPLPRVRVPDADRAAAADRRRVRRPADREPPFCRRQRLRARGPRRRQARRLGTVALRHPPGERRAPAPARFQRRRRTDRPPTRPPTGRRHRRRRREPPLRRRTCHRPSPPRSSTPAGSRSAGTDRIADLEPWLVAQPAVGVMLLLDDPRPRRGTPLALAVAGTDGRVVAADGAGGQRRPPAAPRPARHAARRPRGQAAARRPLRRRPRRRPPTVAFDTQVAAYILNAALRSQTIADVVAENLDQILPPADRPAGDCAGRPRGPRRRSLSASRSNAAWPS